MSKHTPGPWEFVDNTLIGPKIDYKPIWLRPVILRSETGIKASDAHLIAASPDLLDALVSLAAVARRYLPDYDEHPEVQKADATITKATGGAS
jgi:hypothetical protein